MTLLLFSVFPAVRTVPSRIQANTGKYAGHHILVYYMNKMYCNCSIKIETAIYNLTFAPIGNECLGCGILTM